MMGQATAEVTLLACAQRNERTYRPEGKEASGPARTAHWMVTLPRQMAFPRLGPCGRLQPTNHEPRPPSGRATSRADRMYRIGVDIGGTFTDFALFDARGSQHVRAQAADHAARPLARR